MGWNTSWNFQLCRSYESLGCHRNITFVLVNDLKDSRQTQPHLDHRNKEQKVNNIRKDMTSGDVCVQVWSLTATPCTANDDIPKEFPAFVW